MSIFKKKGFAEKRFKLAITLGVLILDYTDYCSVMESKGKKPDDYHQIKFKKDYNRLIAQYSHICMERKNG